MVWLKRTGLVVAALAALVALAIGAAFAANPTLMARYVAVVSQADTPTRIAGLAPLETVKGGAGAPIAVAGEAERTIEDEALDAAIAYVAPFDTQALLVWRAGRLELEWYGAGFDATSRSNPASLMKPVLALAVGAAVAEGRIGSIDDPVAAYVTEWAGDPRGAITIRHLLQMSTGLAHSPFSLNPFSRYITSWLGTDVNAVALDTPAAGPPGASFQYSNINAQILTIALERATGVRYAEWLSKAVWAPMGAGDASVWLDRPGGAARGYCCLIATARDWLRVGLLIKDRGMANGVQVVPGAWVDAMTAPSPANPNFGYQIWRASPYAPQRSYGPGVSFTVPAREPFVSQDMVYGDGNGGQRVYVSPADDLVIVRIGEPTMDWDDSALPNIIARGFKPLPEAETPADEAP